MTQPVNTRRALTIAALPFAVLYGLAAFFSVVLVMAGFMGPPPCTHTISGEIWPVALIALPLVCIISSITLFLLGWRSRRTPILIAIVLPIALAGSGYITHSLDNDAQTKCRLANPNWSPSGNLR